jgi:hypothetical protein
MRTRASVSLAQCRLGHHEALGGPREAQLLGHANEVAQVAEMDVHSWWEYNRSWTHAQALATMCWTVNLARVVTSSPDSRRVRGPTVDTVQEAGWIK